MAQLFIGNATHQYHEFIYMVPGSPNITQRIDPGGQIRISAKGGNLSPEDIEAIVRHHAVYGLIPVSEVATRTEDFRGLCYSIDTPISVDRLREQIMKNREVMISRGVEARRAAAVASDSRLRQDILEQGRPDHLMGLTIEVEEQDSARIVGSRTRETDAFEAALAADSKPIGQGYRVLPQNAPPPPDVRPGRRRR